MSAATAVVDFAGDTVGGVVDAAGDAVGGVVDAAGDVVGGAVDAVSDVGSSIDDFVNEEIPGGWITVGAAALGAGMLSGAEAAATGSELAMPFSEIMELPTAELLSGYDAAAAGATGWSGLDIGDTIPYTEEQIAGLYPTENAFLPEGYAGTEGLDTGDVIPATEEQLAGLYPADDAFLPPETVPVVDMSTPAVGSYGDYGIGTLGGAALGGLAGAGVGSLVDYIGQNGSGSGGGSYGGGSQSSGTNNSNIPTARSFVPHPELLQVPDSFDFKLSDVADPYLTQFQNGQAVGDKMFDPNGQYASDLIRSLRAANGEMPTFINPGFTSFQSK